MITYGSLESTAHSHKDKEGRQKRKTPLLVYINKMGYRNCNN